MKIIKNNIPFVLTLLVLVTFMVYQYVAINNKDKQISKLQADSLSFNERLNGLKAPEPVILTHKVTKTNVVSNDSNSKNSQSNDEVMDYDPVVEAMKNEERILFLENMLSNEAKDDSWAKASEEYVLAFENTPSDGRKAFPNTKIKSVECRTTICEIEIQHKDISARSHWNGFAPHLIKGFPNKIMITTDKDDSDKVIDAKMFMFRDGHDFPKLPT